MKLSEKHMPLVDQVIRSMHLPPQADRGAAMSAGMDGLMVAGRKFGPADGHKFPAFARTIMRRRIIDDIRKSSNTPRRGYAMRKKIDTALTELAQRLMRTPTERELAQHLGVTPAKLGKMQQAAKARFMVSLDADARSGQCGQSLHGLLLAESGARDPADRETDFVYLREAIGRIASPMRRRIIEMLYRDGMPANKIAARLKMTYQNVSLHRIKAINEIRRLFAEIVRRDGQPDFRMK